MVELASRVVEVASRLEEVASRLEEVTILARRLLDPDNQNRFATLYESVEATEGRLEDIETGIAERLSIELITKPRMHIKDVQEDLRRLLDDARKLQPPRGRKQIFKSLRKTTDIDSLLDQYSAIESKLQDLVSHPQFRSFLDPSVPGASEGSQDFRVVMDIGENTQEVHLDFSFADGTPITQEAQFKNAILSPHSSKMVGAFGSGGVGKTIALRGLGCETKDNFKGGVLFTSIGVEVGLPQVVDCIASFVQRAGGSKKATEIREARTFKNAILTAGEWFAHVPCLFLIDDIKAVNGITRDDIDNLQALALHRGSKVAYTTRDHTITSGTTVMFRGREIRGAEARNILLRWANHQPPTGTEALVAFLGILDNCKGVPIALSVSGRAVRRLSEMRGGGHPEKAWELYWNRYQELPALSGPSQRDAEMFSIVQLSLDLLDEQLSQEYQYLHYRRGRCRDIFTSLSIIRKRRTIPFQVVSHIWRLPMSETRTVIELLDSYSIISVDSLTSSLGMHNELLDISRTMAADDRSSRRWIRTVLDLYTPHPGSGLSTESYESISWSCWRRGRRSDPSLGDSHMAPKSFENFQDWWMGVEDDGYIHANICWLLRQGGLLKEEGCVKNIKWLVTNPKWIVDQLSMNGYRQVAEGLDFVNELIEDESRGNQHFERDRDELRKKFWRSLKNAAFMASKHILQSKWKGMPWFQLYGRLVHLTKRNEIARDFLKRLEHAAPRPFVRPCAGCLPAAGESLLHVTEAKGRYLCHALVDVEVMVCYENEDKICIIRYDIMGGTESVEDILRRVDGRSNFASCAQFSKSGTRLAIGVAIGPDGGIIMCHLDEQVGRDVRRHESTRTIEATVGTEIQNPGEGPLDGNKEYTSTYTFTHRVMEGGAVEELWCSGDGHRLVSKLENGVARVWHVQGTQWGSEELGRYTSVRISKDGNRIVGGSRDGTVFVWNSRGERWTGKVLKRQNTAVTSVAIDYDLNGNRLVCGLEDGTVQLWVLEGTGWRETALTGHEGRVRSVAVNESLVVTGSDDGTVCVRKADGAEWRDTQLSGHEDWVTRVEISENGKRVKSRDRGGVVIVWELNDGEWGQVQTVAGMEVEIGVNEPVEVHWPGVSGKNLEQYDRLPARPQGRRRRKPTSEFFIAMRAPPLLVQADILWGRKGQSGQMGEEGDENRSDSEDILLT